MHPAKCLENYSYCWGNIILFSQQVRVAADNRWDFTRESNSCSAHSSGKPPSLCGITGNYPHRDVNVVRLQWQGKENKEVCTWFHSHCSAVKICDCSTKHNYYLFFAGAGRELCAPAGIGLLLQEGSPALITAQAPGPARLWQRGGSVIAARPGGAAEPGPTGRQRCLRSAGTDTLGKQLCPPHGHSPTQNPSRRGNGSQRCPTEEKEGSLN